MNTNDFRSSLNPDKDVPSWFWEIIESGCRDRKTMRAVCVSLPKARLHKFIRWYHDLVSYFFAPPFTDNMSVESCSENELDDVGRWIVSQGKTYHSEVWTHPEKIAAIFKRWRQHSASNKMDEKSYDFVPEQVWRERFGEDYDDWD